jgi:signal peptidase I
MGEDTLSMKPLVELLKVITEKGKSLRHQARCSSMHPFIRNMDYITISPLTTFHPQLGDIVAYIQPETRKLLVHRVIKNKGDSYLIKGDHNLDSYGLIPKANILGYVTRVERDGKKIWFGSGFDRIFIASISHRNLLHPTSYLAYRFILPVIRRIRA